MYIYQESCSEGMWNEHYNFVAIQSLINLITQFKKTQIQKVKFPRRFLILLYKNVFTDQLSRYARFLSEDLSMFVHYSPFEMIISDLNTNSTNKNIVLQRQKQVIQQIINRTVQLNSRQRMFLKTLPLVKNSKLYKIRFFSQDCQLSSNHSLFLFSNNRITNLDCSSPSFQKKSLNQGILFSLSSSIIRNSVRQTKIENMDEERLCLIQLQNQLKKILLSITALSKQRAQQSIDQKVQKELQKRLRHLIKGQQSQEKRINLKIQQKGRIETCFIENLQLIGQIEENQNYRAMIMIRLEILWNQKYENLSIDELTELIYKLESSIELKSNDLKSIALIFLAIETLKKCLNLSRLHRNVVCSSKSLFENFTAIKRSLAGQLEAKSKLEKVEALLNFLVASSQKRWNRLCFMKVQSQIHFLTYQIFKSFHQPHLYTDKSQCLTLDPPRALFDEPFHQEYDRFIQMSVLILFDKRLKKESKIAKIDDIIHIFEQLKVYEEAKFKQVEQNQNSYPKKIKKLKQNVQKMNQRINLMEWVKTYASKSILK